MKKAKIKALAMALLSTMTLSLTSGITAYADINEIIAANESIKSVNLITEVQPLGEKVVAIAVEYNKEIDEKTLTKDTYEIEATLEGATAERTITEIYKNDKPETDSESGNGNYVIIELDSDDSNAGTLKYSAESAVNTRMDLDYTVSQVLDVEAVDGTDIKGSSDKINNTGELNPVVDKFSKEVFTSTEGQELQYRLFTPELESNEKYPLVITMHGSGERGVSNDVHLLANKGAVVWAEEENQSKNPSYVLSPQLPIGADWENDENIYNALVELIEETIANKNVDADRVYITGISRGARGLWALIQKRSDLFAAAMPVASASGIIDLEAIKDMPIWAFHAEDDPTVDVETHRTLVNELRELGSPIKYTEYEAGALDTYPNAHFSWVPAYENKEAINWLYQHTRNKENKILNITVNATVKDLGETVESLEVVVEDDVDLTRIKAEDFIIENAVVDHFGNVGDIKVNDIKVEGNTLVLSVGEFLTIKSDGSMGDELKVTCKSNEELSFTYSDITKIVSPVADKFETKEYNGLTYKLFSPDSDEALPIVIWMHGRGDNGLQLRSARNATMFAEDESQKENPCYVFAPQSDESVTAVRWTDNELENIIDVLEQLIEEGKVDPNRVYLTGHSMGGQGAWNLLRKAPDMFAAAITMAPRIISEQAELDDLAALKDLPVWFFHATNDPVNLVSGSKDRYNKLLEVGNTKLKYTELSDEEMIEFGAGSNTHATNIVMANTPGVIEWLFVQKKEVVNENNKDDDNINEEVNNPTDNSNNINNDTQNNLPQTGGTSSVLVISVALIVILAGVFILKKAKNK